ncbi:MAG: hypothetical protein AAGK09_15480 [Planctomycetota bacterium]
MANLDDLSQEFRRSSAAIEQVDEAVRSAAEINEARLGRDRSWIAIFIIATYAVAVFGIIAYLLFGAPSCAGGDCAPDVELWSKQADYLLTIVSTAVVPIVTLMLGFYFGSEKSPGSSERS